MNPKLARQQPKVANDEADCGAFIENLEILEKRFLGIEGGAVLMTLPKFAYERGRGIVMWVVRRHFHMAVPSSDKPTTNTTRSNNGVGLKVPSFLLSLSLRPRDNTA